MCHLLWIYDYGFCSFLSSVNAVLIFVELDPCGEVGWEWQIGESGWGREEKKGEVLVKGNYGVRENGSDILTFSFQLHFLLIMAVQEHVIS